MIAVNVVSLNEILFKPELGSVLRKLRVKEGTGSALEVERLLTEAQAVAKPKALYGVAYVEERGEDSIGVDGQTFKSRVLRVNLEPVHRIFPFVATCGTELDEWSSSIDDMLQSYWADAIKEMALRSAIRAL
ncbi:MAG: vitamin B12 dependent methionine synthase, partial [Anaerolineae bacterium]